MLYINTKTYFLIVIFIILYKYIEDDYDDGCSCKKPINKHSE